MEKITIMSEEHDYRLHCKPLDETTTYCGLDALELVFIDTVPITQMVYGKYCGICYQILLNDIKEETH